MRRWVPLGLFACSVACGDSLRSGPVLDELFGLTPVPETVAWEMRWFVGAEHLVVSCDLARARVVEDEESFLGEIRVSPPRAQPPGFVETEGVDWALGFPVLVDAERYDPHLPDDPQESLEDWRGVWGAPPGLALLVADGDADALEDELLVDGERALEAGAVWVEVVAPAVAISGRFEGALLVVRDFVDDILVFQTEKLDDEVHEVWSGAAIGWLEPDHCE